LPGVSDALDTNRAHWDALAAVHGAGIPGGHYDLDAVVAGRGLGDAEQAAVDAAVGSLEGLDVLHLQCHVGIDSIALARAGARVTGVDLSPGSLAAAGALAQRCGVELALVEAEATALPQTLHDRFDLVYATVGVICWIEDIGAWMRSAASALRPGGTLVLIDAHPIYQMALTFDPLDVDFPYAFDGPHEFDNQGSYADPSADVATKEIVYAHSLGEIVNAALAAGLRIDALEEHLDTDADPRGSVAVREADGRYRMRLGGVQPLPLLFTLRATRTCGDAAEA
jgi:SAM-dependent methyltransferase